MKTLSFLLSFSLTFSPTVGFSTGNNDLPPSNSPQQSKQNPPAQTSLPGDCARLFGGSDAEYPPVPPPQSPNPAPPAAPAEAIPDPLVNTEVVPSLPTPSVPTTQEPISQPDFSTVPPTTGGIDGLPGTIGTVWKKYKTPIIFVAAAAALSAAALYIFWSNVHEKSEGTVISTQVARVEGQPQLNVTLATTNGGEPTQTSVLQVQDPSQFSYFSRGSKVILGRYSLQKIPVAIVVK